MPFTLLYVQHNLLAGNGFTHDMRGGECAWWSPVRSPRAELLKQPSPALNSVMSDVWSGSYRMINRANLVLAKRPELQIIQHSGLAWLGSQILRAWAYFELVSQ
jgi:hypothetical protein